MLDMAGATDPSLAVTLFGVPLVGLDAENGVNRGRYAPGDVRGGSAAPVYPVPLRRPGPDRPLSSSIPGFDGRVCRTGLLPSERQPLMFALVMREFPG
jgi:hypothetical protein